MSFTKKTSLQLTRVIYVALLLFFIALVISSYEDIDHFGFIVVVCLIAYIGYKLYKTHRQLETVADDEPLQQTLLDLPPAERIKTIKRLLLIGVPAIIVLSIYNFYELQQLESGQRDEFSTWAPIAVIYNYWGFWPAVLALPLVGIFVAISLIKQLKTAKHDNQSF